MKNVSRIIAAILAILFVAAVLPGGIAAPAAAADADQSNRMNVVLVIDGSRSLIWEYGATDPDGYRYDAIDLFLALLTERGNHVSTIVFSGQTEFQLDTGFLALDGRDTKLSLSEQIRAVELLGGTNIGAALDRAVEEAAAKNAENGLPSVVILFSDGRTDVVEEMYTDSIRSKETAVKNAQAEGIPVYTICLAAPGTDADPDELREIAERTNGKFEKVTNAEALSLEFETFYEMIFGASGAQIQQAAFSEAGTLSFPVTIPSHGAEEVNVIVDTRGLDDISIEGPDASYTKQELEQISMHGGYYQVIKLVNPTPGKWHVQMQGVPEKNVTVNVLFNINSIAALTTEDGRTEYDSGDQVTFCANLLENGSLVLEPEVTTEYTAELILTENATGKTEPPILMTPDGQGTFRYTMTGKSYSTYTAVVNLVCDKFKLVSNELTVTFDNTPPSATTPKITVEKWVFTPFFGGQEIVDMSDYFTDDQDDTLTYRIISSQLRDGTYDLDELSGILTVDTSRCKSGEVVIEAIDSQSAPARTVVYFDIFDLTFWGWGTAVLIFGGLLAFLVILLVANNMLAWKGDIRVTDLHGVGSAPRTNFRGSLNLKVFNLPGSGIKGKFKAGTHNQLYFISKRPVYLEHAVSGTKRLTLRAGKVRIFADAQRNRGIEVEITPDTPRRGGFDFGGGSARRGRSGKTTVNRRPGSTF